MKPKGKFAAKILCSAMTLAMAGALLPVSAAAQDIQTLNDTDTGMYVSKTATLEDDGTYTIDLEAYATGETVTTVTQKPTDVVLVLDVSGSMADNFTYEVGQEYVEDFSTKIKDLPDKVRYHKCPDGTYSTVTWTEAGESMTGIGTFRYVCDHYKATRKWNSPLQKNLGDTRDDPWNLYELKTVTKTENKLSALQAAAKGFVDAVEEKNAAVEDESQKHRVSIVKFAGNSTSKVGNDTYNDWPYTYNYTQIVNNMTVVDANGANTLKNSIDALTASGATAVDYGMTHAESLLRQTPGDRNKIVVVFTDGKPTHSNSFDGTVANNAIKTAKALKDNGAKIYTIGVFSNANPNDTSTNTNAYMNALSSNYPNATGYKNLGTGKNDGYYKTVTASEDLSKIFEEISESVGKTEVQLDANSVIKDIMGDGFVLKEGVSKAEVSEVPYSGRDRNGNRVFGTQTSSTATAEMDWENNTVKVSGFDFSHKYLLDGDTPDGNDFTAAKQGSKLVIRITGVEATDDAIRNSVVYTNNEKSGIYANADSQEPDIVFPNCTTKLTSTSYVLDYGKSFNATANDPENGWDASQVTSLQTSMDRITNTANASVDMTNGKADKKDTTTVTYTPQTMSWNGYDSFYAFGKVSDGTTVSTGANQWSKINVIPANNVYYEDDFITNTANGTVGIEYSGSWNMVGTTDNNDETANGDVQGWETSLADDTTYSDGSAHQADAKGATATFTFTGTGVDIYSRTDMTTGTVNARLYRGDNTTAVADMIKSYTVDNKSESDTYYQIPTLHFENLEHGTYTVKITVLSTSDNRSTYYLDGVRVYNPLSNEQEMDETVQNAYGNEVNAVFQTVRDLLITSAGDSDTFDGPVFIDKIDGETGVAKYDVADYVSNGPKNEVYLANGQSIVLAVGDPNLAYHIGLKAPDGETTSAEISNGSEKTSVTISAASDLYYTVVPNESGMIEIQNTGSGLLSVTKLRISGEPAVSEMSFLRTFSLEEALNYANSFDALPVSEETQEPMEPDAEESVEPEQPEATAEPEQSEENTGDVVIENPEPVQPEQPVVNQAGSILSKLFGGLRNLFRW